MRLVLGALGFRDVSLQRIESVEICLNVSISVYLIPSDEPDVVHRGDGSLSVLGSLAKHCKARRHLKEHLIRLPLHAAPVVKVRDHPREQEDAVISGTAGKLF